MKKEGLGFGEAGGCESGALGRRLFKAKTITEFAVASRRQLRKGGKKKRRGKTKKSGERPAARPAAPNKRLHPLLRKTDTIEKGSHQFDR